MTYHIGQFDGPLDVLLSLISKNKIDIFDIPISLICDQYIDFIENSGITDMELLGEFLTMACRLMLIKSKMLLPRPAEAVEDPRAGITDALLRFQQAKEVSAKLSALYTVFSGRMVKDTDEISVDKTFVLDQKPEALVLAIHKINVRAATEVKTNTEVFTPMIRKPIISIDKKIRAIVGRVSKKHNSTIRELLDSAKTVPDIIATFLGVLELIKTKTLIIDESADNTDQDGVMHGIDTNLIYNPDAEVPIIGDGRGEENSGESSTKETDGADND